MRALIVEDGRQRSALAAARALRAAGWSVGIASPERGFASWSRASKWWHEVPKPSTNLDAFVAQVEAANLQHGYDIVFPCGDAEVFALSAERDRLSAKVPYPPHADVVRAFDKLTLTQLASAAGIATPRTAIAGSDDARSLTGPTLIKARTHWVAGAHDAPGHLPASILQDQSDAHRHLDTITAAGSEAILQELIEGDLIAYVAVFSEGRVIAEMQQLAFNTWPADVGVSARAVTTPVDAALSKKVANLLERLNWQGLAEIQFLRPPGGEPHLIDLNGRFYGSMELARAAGLNLPALWADAALGRAPSRTHTARTGVHYQWLEGDLRRAFAQRTKGLLRDVAGALAFAPRARHSVWGWSDPAPLMRHLGRLGRRGTKRIRA